MGNVVKWYRIKSKLNINTKNKKVKTIIYNSFDLFYCLKLFLFNKCRGPPTPFNFQILKLNGGIKMDKPTTFEVDGNELFADFNNKKYFIKFKNYENKEITSEIPKEVFFAYIESKKEIKKRLRIFLVKPLVVSYVCVPDLQFSCTFICVSKYCKSARLNKSAMHRQLSSAHSATSRDGSPLLCRS